MYNDNRLNELNQIISNVIYKENQKALDSGCDVLCTATEYLADKIAEEVFKYHREEIDALRWTNKQLVKSEKKKRIALWKKAVNQFMDELKTKWSYVPNLSIDGKEVVDTEDIEVVAKEMMGNIKE